MQQNLGYLLSRCPAPIHLCRPRVQNCRLGAYAVRNTHMLSPSQIGMSTPINAISGSRTTAVTRSHRRSGGNFDVLVSHIRVLPPMAAFARRMKHRAHGGHHHASPRRAAPTPTIHHSHTAAALGTTRSPNSSGKANCASNRRAADAQSAATALSAALSGPE